MLRRLLIDGTAEVRIGTVERNGRHYLSLEKTLDLSIAPLLPELDRPALAAVFDLPMASPQIPGEPVALGESTTARLRDGWNAVPLRPGATRGTRQFASVLRRAGSPPRRAARRRTHQHTAGARHHHTGGGSELHESTGAVAA